MTHLQNKSHGFQQTLIKPRNQYTFHPKFKCEPYQPNPSHPELYYSDEESSVKREEPQGDEMQHIMNEVQGEIERNYPKEDTKMKKTKSTKKKGCKSRHNKQPQTSAKPTEIENKPVAEKAPNNQGQFEDANMPPITKKPPSSNINIAQRVQRDNQSAPSHQHERIHEKMKVNLPSNEQSEMNRLQAIKARIDKKFVISIGEGKSRLSNEQICFKYMGDYRAYFQKQTNQTYQEFQSKWQAFKDNVAQVKINQLIMAQKSSKLSLIKKVQLQSYKHRQRKNNTIESIQNPNASNRFTATKQITPQMSALRASEKNIVISNQQRAQEKPQKDMVAENKSPTKSMSQSSGKGNSLQKRRSEKNKQIENIERLSSSSNPFLFYNISQTNRNLQVEVNKLNDRKKILASIEIVNQQCEQYQKHLRIESERQEREREEKEKHKVRKEPASHTTTQEHKHQPSEENQSERRRQENIREAQWYSYHKSNPKIKRLQILNRYHYNPFEENEGQDQCELWKKLMGIQIKNLRCDASIKNQQSINQHLIDELLRDAEECDRHNIKSHKLNSNDIFILPTNYKPPEVDTNQDDQYFNKERSNKSKKSKSIKKNKNKHKKNKQSKQTKSLRESQDVLNNSIDHFLDFGGTPSKNVSQQDQIQDFTHPFKAQQQSRSQQHQEPEYPQQHHNQSGFQEAVQHLISSSHHESIPFNYDQLPDFQVNEEIKRQCTPSEPADELLQMDYLQKLPSKQGRNY